jgi:hypothetical protein
LEDDEYESLTLVYCKEIDTMVPFVRVSLQIPPRMQGSWNDDDVEMLKVVVESSRGVDGKPSLNIEGSLQYYHK